MEILRLSSVSSPFCFLFFFPSLLRIERKKKKGGEDSRNRGQFLNSKKRKLNEMTVWMEAIYVYIYLNEIWSKIRLRFFKDL